MARFGDFQALCTQVPSYTWCNLFYRQLQTSNSTLLTGLSQNAASAPVGVNPECGIPKVNTNGSLGNIANIIACGLSSLRRRKAGSRVELRIFFALYLLTLPFQLITSGSLLTQGSTVLATQIVEDGTLSSIVPFSIFSVAFFVATTYISLDVGLTLTHVLGTSNPPQSINSIPLFVLTSIWPGVAALIYFGIMLYIVLGILNEIRPVWYYVIAAILFVLSQLDYFLLSKIICRGSSSKVDGSFIATILETACVVALYFAWRGITEGNVICPLHFNTAHPCYRGLG
ncbi:chitin synthase III catalytic subunit-domain-containing protein [Suillus lakei]|nr:chitin synthase III catalytic subunit-domain-containing protein [Suillus lakei]